MAERHPLYDLSVNELLGRLMRTVQSWGAGTNTPPGAVFSGFALECGMALEPPKPGKNVRISLEGDVVGADELHEIVDNLTARLSAWHTELPAAARLACGEAALARAVAVHTLIDAVALGGN